ncbi:hypothetical protein D6D13_00488 [Aureobasidium pullulans]|uniref:Uncharacterized protein n=1 Tax=Aureobasidium pullulans TaxID=5580 RepID=A0A4S9DCJ4_AURPU|nr:hypothetical protein D6D13_00488 [Aureobasidium pullulans]
MAEAWTEADYEAALAKLEALTDKVTALRTTIPGLISPLTRPATTKSAAFVGLKKAAIGAVTGVQDLRKEWESNDMQDLLKRTKESYGKDSDLAPAAEVSAWGWTKEDEEKSQRQQQQQPDKEVKTEDGVAG